MIWAYQVSLGDVSIPEYWLWRRRDGLHRQVGEDRIFQDNFTRIVGRHSLKAGYQMAWTLFSNKPTSLPSGQYTSRRHVSPFYAEYRD